MVIPSPKRLRFARRAASRGMLMTELMMGMAILLIAVIPIGFSLLNDARLAHTNYQRAVAMEIVDGEMEILAAGEWRSTADGAHPYPVRAAAATNLPPGQFTITRTGNHLRLEWKADELRGLGIIVREVTVK